MSKESKTAGADDKHTRLLWTGVVLLVAGLGASTAAYLDDPRRFSYPYLWGFSFVWAVVLGSLFFVALQHLTGSVWSVVIRRVGELLAAPMWLVALLFIPVLLFAYKAGFFGLFPGLDAAHAHGDHVLHGKAPYLNFGFFALRAGAFWLIWLVFARLYVGVSLRQDAAKDGTNAALRMRRISPAFMMLFAMSVTFASFDWLMGLNPHWFSTIFGVYVFAGMFASGLAAITLATIYLRAKGHLGKQDVRRDHLYNLGALLFGFSCFWAYIGFSQFMLIWYGHMPEETMYYYARLSGPWGSVTVLLALLRFVLPFLLLMSRRAKMSTQMLIAMSSLVLIGQLVDLYWMIMPELHKAAPVLGWAELAPLSMMVGAVLLIARRFSTTNATTAIGDPLLAKSRAFHL